MTNENLKYISEALVQLADNRKEELFGQIVVFAGGSGSGKGFVLGNLVDVQGKIFDVDKLKSLALKVPGFRKKFEEVGIDPDKPDLKNPEQVSALHKIIGTDLNLGDKYQEAMFTSALLQPADRKPNLIFDITLKNFSALEEISFAAKRLGYDLKNLHVIWVVNDVDTAKAQNKKRDRVVDEKILELIHMQVALTIKTILNYGYGISKYFDGKMFLVFNNQFEDDIRLIKNQVGNFFIKDAKYLQVKKRGEAIQRLDNATLTKLQDYTKTDFKT